MKVKDVMTADPACCISETDLQEVAQMMIDQDCGADNGGSDEQKQTRGNASVVFHK
jgi:hypothetical protein